MSTETNKEKAGAKAPATSSKVEETQNDNQGALDLSSKGDAPNVDSLTAQVSTLTAELDSKNSEIENLKKEHEAFKAKLKPEIEKIQAENNSLKDQVASLQAEGSKSTGKSKGQKSAPKFIVVSAFRGIQENDKVFDVDADVSHFDSERLATLIAKGLVKEVK
ncbi:hypothetical protein ORI89_17395 [Sphingobacterium sp. UT-1RO-CII-1]|uniref:hypothetical protein n=1 Tax=Sphingobacterium sp. UT-1RO-CII-1 TaxID=2995225 RepID=UPI00227AFAE4|nr:hypothetical protein [Sphingobacterium sp. UT-1RO-CII-1]MCY4781438.1 hypothetical protein [Sphingobacterium sp. UT-1RO-CII-1]